MSKFEEELKKNNFVCSECLKCKKLVWPSSDFCNSCFSPVTWKNMDRTAKLIEFSKRNDEIFCIAEFENNIRIMGRIQPTSYLKIGQSLRLVFCDCDGKEKFVFEPVI